MDLTEILQDSSTNFHDTNAHQNTASMRRPSTVRPIAPLPSLNQNINTSGSSSSNHSNCSSANNSPVNDMNRSDIKPLHLQHIATKRMAHVRSEQKRRQNINDGFRELRQIMPLYDDEVVDSKAATLKKAVNYIRYLQSEVQRLLEAQHSTARTSPMPTPNSLTATTSSNQSSLDMIATTLPPPAVYSPSAVNTQLPVDIAPIMPSDQPTSHRQTPRSSLKLS